MSTIQNQNSTVSPEVPLDDRVYYTYGDLDIDLKHYIHNLNSNLNRFLDSRRTWSEGQKLAFRERFDVLNQGLQAQLDTLGDRFNTSSSGILNDLSGELANGKDVIYVDKDGNAYTQDEIEDTKGLQVFDVSRELANYANKIGGAIAVRGLNRSYYEQLKAALLKAEERKRQAAERAAIDATDAAATVTADGTEAGAGTSSGFLDYLKTNSLIYDSTANDFRWQDIYDQDPGSESFTERATLLASLLHDYYTKTAQNNKIDSNFADSNAFVDATNAAIQALADGYQPDADNAALNKFGMDVDFLGNWFSSKSPEEKRILAERQAKLNASLASIPDVDITSNPINLGVSESNPYSEGLSDEEKISFANLKLLTFAKNLGIYKKDGQIQAQDSNHIEEVIEKLEKHLIDSMLENKDQTYISNLATNLFQHSLVFEILRNEGSFIKDPTSNLYYLDYRNPKKGVVVVYNSDTKQVYLKKIRDLENSVIYDRIIADIDSYKLGGKFLTGGDIQAMLKEAATKLQGSNPDAYKSLKASLGWNAEGNLLSDENGEWHDYDTARIIAMAANIGMLFNPEPISGAVVNVGASLGDLYADLRSPGVSTGSAFKNLGLNLGMDAIGLVEGGDLLKVGKSIQKSAKVVAKGLALYGVLDGVANSAEIVDGLINVSQGDFTRENLQRAGLGIMLLSQAIVAGKAHHKTKKAFKESNELVVEFKDSAGNDRSLKVKDPAIIAKLKENLYKPDEVNKILNNELGLTGAKVNTTWGHGLYSTTAGVRMPHNEAGKRSPVYIKRRSNIFAADAKIPYNLKSRAEGAEEWHPTRTEEAPRTTTEEAVTGTEHVAEPVTEPAVRELNNIDEFDAIRTADEIAGIEANSKTKKETIAEKEKAEVAKQKLEEELTSAKKQIEKDIKVLSSEKKDYTTLSGETLKPGKKMADYASGVATQSRIATKKKEIFSKYEAELNKAQKDFEAKLKALEKQAKNGASKEEVEIAVLEETKKYREVIQKISQESKYETEALLAETEEIKKVNLHNINNSEKAKNEYRDSELAKFKTEREFDRKLEEVNKKLDLLTESSKKGTGWKELQEKLLSEEGVVIGGKRYKATPEILKEIGTRYGYLEKQGGILKALNGVPHGIQHNGSWEDSVGKSTWAEIVKILNHDKDYYKTINEFQRRHAAIRTKARGGWDKERSYVGGADKSIESYQTDYHKGYQGEGYDGKSWNTIAIGPNWSRYDYDKLYKRTSGDSAEGSWKSDNLYAGITDDRRLLGRILDNIDDYGDGVLTAKNEELKSLGLEVYLDKATGYYMIRPIGENTPGTEIDPETEGSEELEDGEIGHSGGEYGSQLINGKPNITEKVLEKLPDLAEYLRMRWLNRGADRLTNMALSGIKPYLQDPYEVNRLVHGDLRAKNEGELAAAKLINAATRHPLTSDGSLQTASLMEAAIKGLQYIDAGNKADDTRYRETQEKAWTLEKDNTYNRWLTAMNNRKSLRETNENISKIRHAGESVKINNTNTYLMDVIKNAKEKLKERAELIEYADQQEIERLALVNPEALGLQMSNEERLLYQAVASGDLSYTKLTTDQQSMYRLTRQKIKQAQAAYIRSYKGLPKSRFQDAIQEGLDNSFPLIINDDEETPTFKEGGELVKATKIRERIKNADRHQKNIHKLIDSLDKKLDRISRSLYGVGKVANLR